MQGDSHVIEALNDVLTAELTAINQYFVHHKMCENWGYERLSAKKREESIEEMKDAQAVIERILYLDGIPNMQRLAPVRVGEDPIEQHRLDLAVETEAIARLNSAITLCREKGDNGTRELLEGILKGEEESADWPRASSRAKRSRRTGWRRSSTSPSRSARSAISPSRSTPERPAAPRPHPEVRNPGRELQRPGPASDRTGGPGERGA
jgi:bacterioferritin